jgi:hypothetical protein
MPRSDVPCAKLLKHVKQHHANFFLAAILRKSVRGMFSGDVELVMGHPQLNLA